MRPLLALAAAAVLAVPALAQEAPQAPDPAQQEYDRLVAAYRKVVREKDDAGWETGWTGDAKIMAYLKLHPDASTSPPRQIEHELARAKAGCDKYAAKGSADLTKLYQDQVDEYTNSLKRPMGICTDWADAVDNALDAVSAPHWTHHDVPRKRGASHYAVLVCPAGAPGAQADPNACKIFDPWPDGKPGIYPYPEWDQASWLGRLVH